MNAERHAQLLQFLQGLGLTAPAEMDLERLDEALTHTSAGLSVNHEKLEFLGDAVLRLAASEFLEQHYPNLSVGQSSALRAQLVSDRWLGELGQAVDIDAVLRIGPTAAGDTSARETLRAEACEACIGALYRLGGTPGLYCSGSPPTGKPQPRPLEPIPTCTTGNQPCRNGGRAKNAAYRITTAKRSAKSTPIPGGFTLR